MIRTMLSSLAVAATLAMLAAGTANAQQMGKRSGAPTSHSRDESGNIIEFSLTDENSKKGLRKAGRLKSTAGKPQKKGSSSTYLRMSQPPAGGSSARGSVPRGKLRSDGANGGGKAGNTSDFNQFRRKIEEGFNR